MFSLPSGEPALIAGAIQAVLAVAVSFGLHLTPEQIGGIMAASSALMALLVRNSVTPASKP